ncbi:MAG TPA: HEAT repeat domain-containing protein [Polyangiaceae bacterium]
MGWFRRGKGAWDLESVEPPWEARVSIYEHVRAHVVAGVRGLTEGGERLPDEREDGELGFVAGGLDGAFGRHGGGGSNRSAAKLLHRLLRVVLDDASANKLEKLYDQLLEQQSFEVVDPLLERIVERRDLDTARLQALAVWLATRSPDREPVKFAIALLGTLSSREHQPLVSLLGRHEEFTLFAAVALSNLGGDEAEEALFELARNVDGWGRIEVVERLAETRNPVIKAWMLREGYKNSIMYEYLAYTCAVAGGLEQELEAPAPDRELLLGAGDILVALITGGPAEDIDDYIDGAAVVERYLVHAWSNPSDLDVLITAARIGQFLDQEADWSQRASRGFTPKLREELRDKVAALKALPHWKPNVTAALSSTDSRTFERATRAADALGIDTWEYYFARLEAGRGDGWYFVMQTDDPGRLDRVLELAERRLPLDEIATGPAGELGLGPKWVSHGYLDFVLQELGRFPEKGWPLIRAGLRSPVTRNRHMALRALSTWELSTRPADANAVLRKALQDEPDDDVREELEAVLSGRPLVDKDDDDE